MTLFTDIKDFAQGLFRGFTLFFLERPATYAPGKETRSAL